MSNPEDGQAPRRPVGAEFVRRFDKGLAPLDRAASTLVGLALVTITFVLFASALGRYALGFSLVGGEELARYLMVWMTFLGTYVLVRRRGHIAIDILPRLAPDWATRWLGVATGMLGFAVMAYLAWYGSSLASRMLSGGQFSPVLPIPRGVLHLSMPVGAGLSVLAFLHMTLAFLLDPVSEMRSCQEVPKDD